jgi:NAD(P)-dependent dehydrogenase (short-subunit alcohol dehydrogenase family)
MMCTTRKVAIITGASGGIGAGLVAGYRRRDWAVVASARTIKPSPDPSVLAVAADITEPATVGQIIDAALERFGRIDTLVNNAGVIIAKTFTDYTAADYATVVGVGLTGFFWLTQRAVGEMAVRYGGHVVTVGATPDRAADSGAPAVLAALAMGGVVAATRSLAVEYAACEIRINALAAGVIQPRLSTFLGPGRVWIVARVDIDDGLDGAQVKALARGIESDLKHESQDVYRVDVVPIGGTQARDE